MKYYIETTLEGDFETVVNKVKVALKTEGFGVLTEIDIHEKLKEKLGVVFKKYKILGACNPAKAFEALQVENNIGLMLPCNIIVQESQVGKIDIAAIDPVASMKAVDNKNIEPIACEVRDMLTNAILAL
jgi:uncharacterized protein (DUF302 family)